MKYYGTFDKDGFVTGFYTSDIHKIIAEDAVELTFEQYELLLNNQNTMAFDNGIVVEKEKERNLTWEEKRLLEYPSIFECVHALLDGGQVLSDLQALRQAVKDKYPKNA